MNPLMYDASIKVFDRSLGALVAILDKAVAHADARGFSILRSCPTTGWPRTCSR
jgi:hypothetical protein